MKKMPVTNENIHDLIDAWHNGDSTEPLHAFLGLTWEEYAHWATTDELPNTKTKE